MKKMIRFLSFLLITVQFILFTPRIDLTLMEAHAVDPIVELRPVVSAPVVDIEDPLIISYEDVLKDECTFVTACDGVTVEVVDEVDYLSFEVSAIENMEFGSLIVTVTDEAGNVTESKTYMYNNGIDLYYNEFAAEQAWYEGTKALYDLNTENEIILSYKDWEEEYSQLMSSILSGEPSVVSTGNETTTIEGILDWVHNNPAKLPLRFVYVEAIIKTNSAPIVLGSGYTDENGNYSIEINNADWNNEEDVYIRINLEAHTFKVRSGWWTFPYYFDRKLPSNLDAGADISFDATVTCDESKKIYKATYVHQSMVIAERFAKEMGFETSNKIRVAYPAGTEEALFDGDPLAYLGNSGFCWGPDDCYCLIGLNNYKNADAANHEYAHFIQCSLGNFGGQFPEVLYKSTHLNTDDDYLMKKDKEFAMHLSWAEGWADAFAILAQRYYRNQYDGLSGLTIVPPLINLLSVGEHDNYLGEFQEKTTTGFLWELLDITKINYTIEKEDELDYKVPWTPQEWWDMTTVSGTCRFPDFMRLLEEELYDESMGIDYKNVKIKIAEKLSKYNIAPEIISIVQNTDDPSIAPVINLVANGSATYPNNRIVIKVFDYNCNLIAQSEIISIDKERFNEFDFQIPQTVWDEVLNHYSCAASVATIRVSVYGHRYDVTEENGVEIEDEFKLTGPYYSQYMTITAVLPHDYAYQSIDFSSHQCTCADCGHTVTEAHNRTYVIVDNSQHKYICTDCGTYELIGHVADVNYQDPTMRFSRCRYCGALYRNDSFTPIIKNQVNPEETTE